MYLTSGHFTFKQEHIDRAKELMNEIVAIGRQEKGINSYTFYASPDKENSYFLFEEWDSKELHDIHFNSDAMQKIVPEFFELLAGPPSITYYDASIESTL